MFGQDALESIDPALERQLRDTVADPTPQEQAEIRASLEHLDLSTSTVRTSKDISAKQQQAKNTADYAISRAVRTIAYRVGFERLLAAKKMELVRVWEESLQLEEIVDAYLDRETAFKKAAFEKNAAFGLSLVGK